MKQARKDKYSLSQACRVRCICMITLLHLCTFLFYSRPRCPQAIEPEKSRHRAILDSQQDRHQISPLLSHRPPSRTSRCSTKSQEKGDEIRSDEKLFVLLLCHMLHTHPMNTAKYRYMLCLVSTRPSQCNQSLGYHNANMPSNARDPC